MKWTRAQLGCELNTIFLQRIMWIVNWEGCKFEGMGTLVLLGIFNVYFYKMVDATGELLDSAEKSAG